MRLLSGIGWITWMSWLPGAPAGMAVDAPHVPRPALVAPSEYGPAERRLTGGVKRPMLVPRPLADDLFYDISRGSASLSALLDWHPFGSGFRTTGGIMVNSRQGIAERVLPRGAYGLSPAYSVVSLRRRTLDFYQPTPYLGVGWGRSLGREHDFNLSLDVGVMVQSTETMQLAAAGLGDRPTLLGYLASGNFTDLARSLSYAPVVSMGMGWRF